MSRQLPQFGPYTAVRRLGAGGMAETFVALRQGPGGFEQRVCIKRVLPAYADDRDFVDSFLREARTSAALRHANIVQVLDFGLAEDSYYLALELIDGLDLRALTVSDDGAPRSPLDSSIVTLIAGEIAAALEHAHTGTLSPVVHRDISPSNVLISRAGEVKLTDFGIARALGGSHLTATGVIKGKIPYLPPEYVENGTFDQRSDLFSLGVMVFELLAGVRPFDGESDLDTIRRIAAGERRDLNALVPGLPAPLMACVDRLLALRPDERFASARALLDALPPVPVHPTRKALADLVRAKLGEALPHGSAVALVPAGALDPTHPSPAPRPAPASAAAETRTALPSPITTPARGPWVALAGAGLACVLLLTGVIYKLMPMAAPVGAATQPPRPPQLPTGKEEAPVQPSPVSPPPNATPTAEKPQPDDSAPRSERAAEIRVVVIPFGDVWIDGKAEGHAPVAARLAPGTHEIGVGDGRPDQQRSVQLRPGEHQNLVFRRLSQTEPH